jgi:putative membrane protein
MTEYIKMSQIISVVVYTVVGLVFFWGSFIVIDKVTPYDLWKEICEKNNVALGIIVGAMSIGIAMIVSAAIHG